MLYYIMRAEPSFAERAVAVSVVLAQGALE